MIYTKELRRLAQAVSEWSNCNQAWLDQSEDDPAAVVGYIDEDGITYPVATIDCDQYYAAHHSLPLAKFYAAANPAVVSELLDRLEAAEKKRDEFKRECFGHISDNSLLRAKVKEMEQQEPVAFALYSGWARKAVYLSEIDACEQRDRRQLTADLGGSLEAYRVVPLYLAPGAKGE